MPDSVSARSCWVNYLAVIVLLGLALVGADLLWRIPPLGDDFTILRLGQGDLSEQFARTYGWFARPVGVALVDAVTSIARTEVVPIALIVLAIRVMSLVAVYVGLTIGFRLTARPALVATALFAVTPASVEAWTMLNVAHQSVGAGLAALSCGIYARAVLSRNSTGVSTRRMVGFGALAQMATYVMHDQALLAIPAFVSIFALAVSVRKRLITSAGLAPVVASTSMALAWIGAMLASGYVAAKSQTNGGAESAVEIGDIVGSAERLWLGLVQQHLWRVTEVIRTRSAPGWMWDTTSVMSFLLLLGVSAAAASLFFRRVDAEKEPMPSSAAGSQRSDYMGARIPLVLAALAGAYAAVLTQALAYPGVPLVSRMYYLPGFFAGLAGAVVMETAATRHRVATVIVAFAALLWCGVAQRKYLAEMAGSASLVRQLAETAAMQPDSVRRTGILVIAPDVYGTFSVPAVQTWSFRGAIARVSGVSVAPLRFARSCTEATLVPPQLLDEQERPADAGRLASVIAYVDDTTRPMVGTSVANVCRRTGAVRRVYFLGATASSRMATPPRVHD